MFVGVSGIKSNKIRGLLAELFLRRGLQAVRCRLLRRERDFEAAFVVVPARKQRHVVLFPCRKYSRHRFRQKISVHVRIEIKALGLGRRECIQQFLRRDGPQLGQRAHS